MVHSIFLLESTVPKILEYWKLLKMFRKTTSPRRTHIALHQLGGLPTYTYPIIYITRNLPNLTLKALVVKELQLNHTEHTPAKS